MPEEIEYTYTTEYCAYLEKPTAELTWEEQVIECAHPSTNCANCEHCRQLKKAGMLTLNPAEQAF